MVFKAAGNTNRIKSLPSRERGLKSIQVNILLQAIHVAPFAGAWIEILPFFILSPVLLSLPSRERGLKYSTTSRILWRTLMSLPSRERGLK